MALTTIAKIRQVSGISSSTDISDTDLTQLLTYSDTRVISDLYKHIYHESIGANPDTGNLWNGTNYTFQVQQPPIADRDASGTVDDSDITVTWIDSDYGVHTDATVTIVSASEGIITIKNGSDPLASTVLYVWVDYDTPYGMVNSTLLDLASALYCSHLAHLRVTEPDKVTLADLESNRPLVEVRMTRFLEEYNRIIREVHYPKLRST